MRSLDSGEAGPDAVRVAETLEKVKAGVRQQQAALAAESEDFKGLPASLRLMYERRYPEEPVCTSHRPFIGPVIVFAKKSAVRLFAQWYLRALVQQQNAFNRAATMALKDLFERQRLLDERLRRLTPERESALQPADRGGPEAG